MEYNNNFLDTYKKYIGKGWYSSSFSSADLERWINNFSNGKNEAFDPKICAHFLLHSLIFYQENQLIAIIESIENRIKSKLNEELESTQNRRATEDEIKSVWDQYKKDAVIIATASPNDVGGSAHYAARLWRNHSNIETGAVSTLLEQIERKGKKHIFFVDDFIGTGSKIDEFFSNVLFVNKEIAGFTRISDVIEKHKNHVDFNISVFAIATTGKQLLDDNYADVNCFYGDLYNEDYNLISDSCIFYDIFKLNKIDIINYIIKTKQKLGENKYELNLPIAFSHGCPNNSLSLYYKNIDTWKNLLKESHPQI